MTSLKLTNIKAAAQIKDVVERLIQFQAVDLVAKKLMTHDQCYFEYTVALRVVFHWAEFSARNDFFCLLTPSLRQLVLNKKKCRSVRKFGLVKNGFNVSDNADVSSTTSEDKRDFEKVKTFIKGTILSLNKAVSMSAVQEIYGTGYEHECERSYRLN